MRRRVWFILSLLLTAGPSLAAAEPGGRPVQVVADSRLMLGDGAFLALYVSSDWSVPQPGITRALVVIHGVARNADVYYRSGLAARTAAGDFGRGTIVIAPQFLADIDASPNHIPPDTLRWSRTGWEGGDAALAPAPVRSYAALDAILTRLADKRLFPRLTEVVIAGHSGGGQVVQRYAIAGAGEAAGIKVRYVVANPSSYAYFSPERPEPAIAPACPGYDDWKYGMGRRPDWLARVPVPELERRYVARDVIYLLGTKDIDPNHPALDKSCMAEAQGPVRYARGKAYVATMRARDGGTPHHQQWDVPGVGHDGDKMLTSACGLAALFGRPGCDTAAR